MSGKRYRLTEEDRAEFGGPEWVFLNFDELANGRAKTLERYERQTGVRMSDVLNAYIGNTVSLAAVRALVWIARDQMGLRTPFDEFDIHTMRIDTEYVPDEDPEEEAATAAPLSESAGSSETPA